METAPVVDPLLGSKVGLYILDRRIGQGGMGLVYQARHERIGQLAAVKVLLRELAQDGKVLQRFLDEARAMTLVQHPSIVKVFDYGQLTDGTPYIMMELLEGESLQERINHAVERGSGLPLHTALAVARQIASALAIIHQKNIIHRDLKPENIYVVPDPMVPSGERVKLLDFGLAKILDEQVRRTTEGMVLGTPLYMSPEQCNGSRRIDYKADVYSLGALLFEMLVGRPPFLAASAAALMYQHVHTPAPVLTQVANDVPQGLLDLLAAMLAKRAAERPKMDEVAARLDPLEQETRGRGPLILHGQLPMSIGDNSSDGMAITMGPEIEVVAQSDPQSDLQSDLQSSRQSYRAAPQPDRTSPAPLPAALPPSAVSGGQVLAEQGQASLLSGRTRAALKAAAVSVDVHAPTLDDSYGVRHLRPVVAPSGELPATAPTRNTPGPVPAIPSTRSMKEPEPAAAPTTPPLLARVPRWALAGAGVAVLLLLFVVIRGATGSRSAKGGNERGGSSAPLQPQNPPVATGADPNKPPVPVGADRGGASPAIKPTGPSTAGGEATPGGSALVTGADTKDDGSLTALGKRKRTGPKKLKLKKAEGDPMAVFREN